MDWSCLKPERTTRDYSPQAIVLGHLEITRFQGHPSHLVKSTNVTRRPATMVLIPFLPIAGFWGELQDVF